MSSSHRPPRTPSKGRVPRSKSGCLTCKRRKVRCSEERPSCNACERLSLSCKYVPSQRQSPETQRERGSANPQYLVRFLPCNQPSRRRRANTSRASLTSSSLSPPLDADEHDSHDLQPALTAYGHDGESGQSVRLSRSLDTGEHDSHDLQPALAAYDPTADMMMQFMDLPDVDFGALLFLDVTADCGVSEVTTQAACQDSQNHVEESPGVSSYPPATPPVLAEDYMVKISSDDHRLIQHFLHSMKQYTTKLKQGSDEDLNCEMFSNMGLFNAQVFHAMMAFSALHLAQTQVSFLAEAELRYQRATALLLQDQNPDWHLDITVATVWFLLQYELLFAKGTVRFCNLLAHLAHVLDSYQPIVTNSLSIMGTRTLVWLSCYDVRALASGGRGGYLLKSLENFLPIRPHLQEPQATFGGGPLSSLSEAFPASTHLHHTSTLRLRFRSNLLHGRILMLLQDDGVDSEVDDVEWLRVHQDLLDIHDIFMRGTDGIEGFPVNVATGKMIQIPGTVTSTRFGHLLALSSLYAAFLDYHQARRTTDRDNSGSGTSLPSSCTELSSQLQYQGSLSSAEYSARIVRIAHFISLHRPKSPQSVWPSLLFSAGFESEDGIHREWILNSLKGTETWAPHFLQTRILLEAIYKYQETFPKVNYADIWRIQLQTTGSFVL